MYIRYYYNNQWSPWSEIPTVERMEELMIYPTKPRAVEGTIPVERANTWTTLLDIQGSGIVYYIFWYGNWADAKIRITIDGVQNTDSVLRPYGGTSPNPLRDGQNTIIYFKNALKIEVYDARQEIRYAIQYALV